MAGDQSNARQRAWDEWKAAERQGVDMQTLGKLQAAYQVARNAEVAAIQEGGGDRVL